MHAVLRLTVLVHDQEKLIEYAHQRVRAAWSEEDAVDELGDEENKVAGAIYEALIGSSEGPGFLDFGIEMMECGVSVFEDGEIVAAYGMGAP